MPDEADGAQAIAIRRGQRGVIGGFVKIGTGRDEMRCQMQGGRPAIPQMHVTEQPGELQRHCKQRHGNTGAPMRAQPPHCPVPVPLDPHCYKITHSRLAASTGRGRLTADVSAGPQPRSYFAEGSVHAPQWPFNSITA